MTQRRSSSATVDTAAMVDTAATAASRTFVLDQSIRYRYSLPITNLRQRLRVVPPLAHGTQRRRNWHLTVHGAQPSSTRTFLDGFGNTTVDVAIPRVYDTVDFALEIEADTDTAEGLYDTKFDHRYLQHTRLTAPDASIRDLASGPGGSDLATLCDRVHGSIDYEWGLTGVRTTASEAMAGGRGVCQDYAHIMLAACRSAGLAARYVSGHLTGEGASHAWVEVLRRHPLRRTGWVAEGWDPTHNRRTTSNYLVVAVGRDYADAAPLSGTYDGGAINTLTVDKHLARV